MGEPSSTAIAAVRRPLVQQEGPQSISWEKVVQQTYMAEQELAEGIACGFHLGYAVAAEVRWQAAQPAPLRIER
jgi:hypothetical protein